MLLIQYLQKNQFVIKKMHYLTFSLLIHLSFKHKCIPIVCRATSDFVVIFL